MPTPAWTTATSSDSPTLDSSNPNAVPGPTEWTEARHGVGPWEGEWPSNPRYDETLLREGDTRNVVDAYRYWSLDAIVADLDKRRHDFHVAIENFEHDMNIGTVVRTANCLLYTSDAADE